MSVARTVKNSAVMMGHARSPSPSTLVRNTNSASGGRTSAQKETGNAYKKI